MRTPRAPRRRRRPRPLPSARSRGARARPRRRSASRGPSVSAGRRGRSPVGGVSARPREAEPRRQRANGVTARPGVVARAGVARSLPERPDAAACPPQPAERERAAVVDVGFEHRLEPRHLASLSALGIPACRGGRCGVAEHSRLAQRILPCLSLKLTLVSSFIMRPAVAPSTDRHGAHNRSASSVAIPKAARCGASHRSALVPRVGGRRGSANSSRRPRLGRPQPFRPAVVGAQGGAQSAGRGPRVAAAARAPERGRCARQRPAPSGARRVVLRVNWLNSLLCGAGAAGPEPARLVDDFITMLGELRTRRAHARPRTVHNAVEHGDGVARARGRARRVPRARPARARAPASAADVTHVMRGDGAARGHGWLRARRQHNARAAARELRRAQSVRPRADVRDSFVEDPAAAEHARGRAPLGARGGRAPGGRTRAARVWAARAHSHGVLLRAFAAAARAGRGGAALPPVGRRRRERR